MLSLSSSDCSSFVITRSFLQGLISEISASILKILVLAKIIPGFDSEISSPSAMTDLMAVCFTRIFFHDVKKKYCRQIEYNIQL
jgi:hypothetical protein